MTQFASKSFNVPGCGVCYRACANRKVPYPHECEGCRVQGKRVNYKVYILPPEDYHPGDEYAARDDEERVKDEQQHES